MSKFEERCSRINDLNAQIRALGLMPFEYDKMYRTEATSCFHKQLPISCIVVSSSLVEACLKWEHFRRNPKKTIQLDEFRKDTLGKLFNEFIDTDVPLDKLVDAHEDLEEDFKKEDFGIEEPSIEVLRKLSETNRWRKIGRIRYVKTRNRFSHGDLFYVVVGLSTLLPSTEREWSDYGIDYDEWLAPSLETVAYVHLVKTLRFMKALTDLLTQRHSS